LAVSLIVHVDPSAAEVTILQVTEMYERYLEDVVRRLVADENSQGSDLPTGAWTEATLGFFYGLGRAGGFVVETNRETVRRVDPDRYEEDLRKYGEPPKEYLVDLCWRNGYGSRQSYHLELALELEWTPTAPAPHGVEDLDEDLYKLLDIKARHKVGILGCAANEVKHLSRRSEASVVSTFAAYVSNGSLEETEYLLVFIDDDDSLADSGVRAYRIAGDGTQTKLGALRYREV